MTFTYSKPKCNKGTKLIKSRCECKTQKKALKKTRKTLKKVKKTEKKPKLSKKYFEDWAIIPGNYSQNKVSEKQLQVRRKRIDEVYEVYKKIKKIDPKTDILKPKDWAYPPEFCYNQQLVNNLRGIKQDLKTARHEAKNKKKVKITIKKKNKSSTKVTVKKRKRCPKGKRKNIKTGKCEPYTNLKSKQMKNEKEVSVKKKINKTQMGTVVIKSINPSLKQNVKKSIDIIKSFTPSVNKQLQSLQSRTPEFGLFGCKQLEISIEKKGVRKCVKWNSKEARDHLLANLNSKMMPLCNDIVAPKQMQSNCWFNSFFMVFFISDKGRKFTRYLRQIMITSTRLDSSKLKSNLRWPFFLLNKCIEASLRSVNVGDINSKFAYLMDTNEVIKGIYDNLPVSLKKKKKYGLAVKIGEAHNPVTYYEGIVNYLDSPLKSEKRQLTMDWVTLHLASKTRKGFEDIVSNHFNVVKRVDKIPDFFVVDFFEDISNSMMKPLEIKLDIRTINGKTQKVKYVLDAAVLRDTKKLHFSAYLTCNGNQYGFDGESHARMQPFKWKSKLNKNTQWRFAEFYETFFNFKNGYQMLLYYRV